MAARKTIPRTTTASLVADELRRRIASGRLAEGAVIRQEALAAELGVSRIPVREALRQLEAEGFVSVEFHKGAIVSKLALEEVAELFDLRIHIETWLLGLALPRMTEADLDRAETTLAAMVANKKIESWGQLNWAFHEALYRPAGRPATLKILRRINDQVDRYIRLQISLTAGQMKAHREHKEILDLCRAKDTPRALAALERHISEVRDGLLDQLRRIRGEAEAKPAHRRRRAG